MFRKIINHSVFRNVTNLGIIQIFTYLSPVIVIPHLYKTVGIEGYGLFSFSNSYVFYFTIILDFGFQLYVTKEIASNRENKEYINKIISSVIYIKTFFLLIISVVYFTSVNFFDIFRENKAVFYIGYIQILGFYFLPIYIFQGFEKIKPLTVISSLTRVCFIFSIVFLIKKGDKIEYVQFLNSLTIFVYGFISFIVGYRLFKISFIKRVSFSFCLNLIKVSSLYFFSRLATSFYTVSNTFVLGVFFDNTIVGIYSVAEKFYFGVQNLLQPLISALYPYVAATKNVGLIRKILIPVTICFTILCVIGIFISPFVMGAIIKDINLESVRVFQILGVVLIFTFPSILLGYPVTAAMGKDKLANIPLWIAATLHIINLFLCQLVFGLTPIRVAFCLLITEATLLIIRLIIIKRYKIFDR